jgi:hypothetical protein
MSRRHGGFKVDETEIGPSKDVAYIAQQGSPALGSLACGGGSGTNGFVGDDVPSHREAYLSQVVRIGGDGYGAMGARDAQKKGSGNDYRDKAKQADNDIPTGPGSGHGSVRGAPE